MDLIIPKDKCILTENYPDRVIEGDFRAFIVEDNKKIIHYEKHNVIVEGARKIMARSVGDCTEPYCINQFRMGGDNSLDMQTALNPLPPNPSDIDLVYANNLFIRNKDDNILGLPAFVVSYPNEPNETSVLFTVKIGKAEANNLDPEPTVYVAAGLFMADGDILFSSQTFPVMSKTTSREFWFEWEIRF